MPGDIEEALSNAEEIAELTGRDKKDVIADLLDDGKLNNSNAIKENTSAIDKATETAEKVHKLLVTLIPILLLVATSGLELGGIINLTPAGKDEPFWEDEVENHEIYWGCTDYNAENYDEWANEDDGSCNYHEDEKLLDIQNHELSLVGDNELKVEFGLVVEGDFCCDDIEIAWEIEVNGFYDDGLRRVTLHSYDENGYINLEQYWSDMEEGNYHARIEVQWMNDMWDEETTNGIIIENEEPVKGCTDENATNYNSEAEEDDGSCTYPEPCEPEYYDYYLTYSDNNTSMVFTYDVDLPCDETQEVELQFLIYTVNSTTGEAPVNYSIDKWNVYNADAEYRSMTLSNFSTGYYDIYTYLINDDGEMMKELKWLNIEIRGSEEDGETDSE